MTSYYSTYITGAGEIVEEALKKQFNDIQILLFLDGLVVFKTKASFKKIKQIRFLNNSFLLIKMFDKLGRNPLKEMASSTIRSRELTSKICTTFPDQYHSFRIIFSYENQIVSVDKNVTNTLEHAIENNSEARLDRSKPDCEVWFVKRREGYGFLGIRFTHKPNYEKILKKGELRPELARILILLSEPNPKDVFIDPFAGSGAIPIERMHSPYKAIFAGDKNKDIYKELLNRTRKLNKRIKISNWDGLDLKEITDGKVNKIVTDPPWGIYQQGKLDLSAFYSKMVQELTRILSKDGLLVLLTAQKELFEKTTRDYQSDLQLLKKYNILVSGKKSALYKLKRC